MLTGLARPDHGKIHIAGIDCSRKPKAAQHLIGVVPDESNLYPELTGFENLCFCASLYGLKKDDRHHRAHELLDMFNLTTAAHRRFAGYSKGMKRKLTVAAGIIHDPDILFLDEPTTGIDVASARQLRQLITRMNERGTTIFLTTHYIEEAERLCNRIAFIVSGKIVQIDKVKNLLQPIQDKKVVTFVLEENSHNFKADISKQFPDLKFNIPSNDRMRVESEHTIRVGALVRFLEDRGIEVLEARRIQPSLEDIFVRVTGIEVDMMRKEKEKKGT